MKRKGFTLMELMIAVTIIGILAGIASYKMAELTEKSKQGYMKGQLANIRSALNIYYSDNSSYPVDDLSSLMPKYMERMPHTKTVNAAHPDNDTVTTGDSISSAMSDHGGWAYVNDENSSEWGKMAVNCTHPDLDGRAWSSH